MKEIELTHALSGDKLYIFGSKVFGYYRMTSMNATMLISDAGALVPVKESILELRSIFKEENNGKRHDDFVQKSC